MLDVGDGVVESLFGQVARFGRVVHHFVAEDGEVERKSQTDWVSGF